MLSICLIEQLIIKAYCGVEVQIHAFLTLVLYGFERSAASPGDLNGEEITRTPYYTAGWKTPRSSQKEESISCLPGIIP